MIAQKSIARKYHVGKHAGKHIFKNLGPLVLSMDAKGNSSFDQVNAAYSFRPLFTADFAGTRATASSRNNNANTFYHRYERCRETFPKVGN